MGVLDLKAYRLEFFAEGSGHRDENGEWVSEPSGWKCVGPCDAIPAGKNNTIQLPDGLFDTFSYTIRNLPVGCREFVAGEKIRLSGPGMSVVLEVKGFARYQHQCKIWA